MPNLPGSAPSFSTWSNGQDIDASIVNSAQDEIVQLGRVCVGSPWQNLIYHGVTIDTDSSAAHSANATAWAAAVAALPSNGGCIFMPPGTVYTGASGLTYTGTKPLCIHGAAMNGTIIRKGSGLSGEILTIGDGSTASINSVRLRDLRFTGSNDASLTGCGVKFNGVTYASAFNCHFAQMADSGLWITNGNQSSAYMQFSNCIFNLNKEHGVTITDTGSGNQAAFSFTGCTFNSNGVTGNDHAGARVSASYEVMFSACNFSENQGPGIYALSSAGYITVSGCHIVGNFRRGLVLDTAFSCTITGNVFYSNNHGTVSAPECNVLFTGSGCERNTFTGNVVIEAYNSQTVDYGVREESSATNNVIANNIIRGENSAYYTTGLSLANTSSTSIAGPNIIYEGSGQTNVSTYEAYRASVPSVTDITAAGTTITTTGVQTYIFTLGSGDQTGAILTAGAFTGQRITLVNTDATNTLTFAAAGTSRVADGTSCVLAALTATDFVYDTASARWFKKGF